MMLVWKASQVGSRAFSNGAQLNKAIHNVAIVGSGLMGSGIAQVTAQTNINVVLVDKNDQILQKAYKAIESSLTRMAKKKFGEDTASQNKLIQSALQRIRLETKLDQAVKNTDLVIEAIVENIDAKQSLINNIESAISENVIVATNTSSLRLSDISAKMKHKERFGGLHFFNPVPMMKLLEVVRGEKTTDQVFESLLAYGQSIGKVTVKCKDTPGFIVNRLLVPYIYEAIAMYERGDADLKEIDIAMKLGAGYPMGPFQLSDYVGLDTLKFIQDGWRKTYGDKFGNSALLDKMVSEGKLGNKSGEGFYKTGN